MRSGSGWSTGRAIRLNEVRPRRPEQSQDRVEMGTLFIVSMKSGLEGRNNAISR